MGWRDAMHAGYTYLTEAVEDRIGYTMVERDKLEMLEAVQVDYRAQGRQLDLLGWHTLDYLSGSSHEMKLIKRLDACRQARQAWIHDPMAGAYVGMMNDFVFGRGVPAPRARNPQVQKVIDDAWNDADNQAVLTGYAAQIAMGTDMSIQSNLFFLIFNDGEDGKVKLGLLDHDSVFDAVRDPENRKRVLYYLAYYVETEWDFDNDCVKVVDPSDVSKKQVRYYAHWDNVRAAEADIAAGLRKADSLPKPPAEKMGDGVVYHIAINRTTEMVFGVPQMLRSLRWFSAYNNLMSARVDMATAAAELIMKRKTKGQPGALAKLAQGALQRGGEIATLPSPTRLGGLPGGTVQENENVTHEAFTLDSGAGNATQDATMIRSQVSAGTRLPQHFLGDQGNANLATATAMELPVQKMVESLQELYEEWFRAFTDMVIEGAVKVGLLKGDLPGEESDIPGAQQYVVGEAATIIPFPGKTRLGQVAAAAKQKAMATGQDSEAGDTDPGSGKTVNQGRKLDGSKDSEGKDAGPDGKVDLGYEFSMPQPIPRLTTDLINSLNVVAKTFDPNGTNVELSRTLLTIALGEGLEMQDPSDAVERIFPPGYQDPLVKMELEQGAAGQQPTPTPGQATQAAEDGAPGGSGLTLQDLKTGRKAAGGGGPGSGEAGPYGTKSGATPPEKVREAQLQLVEDTILGLSETRYKDLPESVRDAIQARQQGAAEDFKQIVGSVADRLVDDLPALAASNGHA